MNGRTKTKLCTSCNKELPATKEYFYRNSGFNGGFNDGFQSKCIACRKLSKNLPKQRLRKEEVKQSDINFKIGSKYKVEVLNRGKIKEHFAGTLIQETNEHITLKHIRFRYCETFKKIDFKNKEYRIQEV